MKGFVRARGFWGFRIWAAGEAAQVRGEIRGFRSWVALHVCRKSPLRRVHCQLVQRLNFETLRVLSIEMPNRDT